MKKIVLSSIALGLIFMSLSYASKATNIDFKVSLTDNCSGTWTGNYTVAAELYYNGQLQCTLSPVTVSYLYVNSTTYTISCPGLPFDSRNPLYEIKVGICRVTSPPCTCSGHGTTNLIYYSELTSTPIIPVTIE